MRRSSRREFLRRSAITTAAFPALAASSGILIASPSPAVPIGANDRIRVGLIGSGGKGRDDLATFLLNPEVDCPVVCDVDDRRIAEGVKLVEEKCGRKPETVKDFRRLVDRSDIDAVVVGTPDHWHALPTILACQAGKDVYVEKPLASSIREGRAMLTAAQAHKRVVQMGTQWRSGAHYRAAAEFVQSGKLGRVSLVHAWV